MAFIEHSKVTVSGIFGDPSKPIESWSFGICTDSIGAPTQLLVDALKQPTGTFMAQVSTSWAKAEAIKLATVGPDGKYTADSKTALMTPAAGEGSIAWPSQVSLVASLQTSHRGGSGRGRFYIPSPKVSLVATSGALSDADVGLMTDACRAWLNAVAAALGQGVAGQEKHSVVASRKGVGANYKVNSVRVGAVLDTLRSRRRSIPEKYGTPLLVNGAPFPA